MALVQESSKQVEEINNMSTSKQVEESSKEVEESSESDEITISERCWADCKNEALYFGYSPLFVHLAAGSLDDKEFYQYVANHEHLLNSFLEVYKLAADQCEDDSDKAAFLGWSNNAEQELERHNSFVEQKLGLNPTKEITLHPATEKYKEFLLATASGNVQVSEIPIHQSKIPAYTLGAMTPSLRIYAFLSKAMQKLEIKNAWYFLHKELMNLFYISLQTPYLHSEDVLDELCDSLTDKEAEVVERLYCQAMRLEMNFFYSRQSEQTLIIPICTKLDPKEERLMLFADFDFTCTSRKLCSVKKLFSFDNEGLYSAFVKLSSPEGQAVSRIFDSGVLKGISLEDIKQAGKCMILHNGCMDFFEKVNNLDVSVNVMSCWSGDLTRSALSGGLDMLKVDGNEFSYADGIFTGEVTRQAHQSVTAKLKYFEDMVQEHASEHGVSARTVYIGDSVSDLLCLLTADIGIVIGSNKSLMKVGKHFGITFTPLFAGVVKEQKKRFETGNPIVWKGGLSGTLYTVASWIEIHAFILGRDSVNEEL
ncbi:hypothetical protein MKW98_031839 [Papaver atlanticum]|uniref:Thiaminase-2/PQQC domain-containing protein n=1 Tax=Papaver atlanticum TaxID=357466 RepID=A0AAD4SF32_9MAGN|nr:hypothetical protein MKW98_031839 [Papaver atlanticum]